MISSLLVSCIIYFIVGVQCLKISSRIDPKYEAESIVSSSLHPYQRSLDPPFSDHEVIDAIFAGEKKPLTVDCTEPGVICKFPLVVTGKQIDNSKPAKQVKEVPIIKGIALPAEDDSSKAERRESLEKKEELVVFKPNFNQGDVKVPIYKGSEVDIESIFANEKDIEETWILEKNILNKKYQIPVKLLPSKHQSPPGFAPLYPSRHDLHDHFNGGYPYHYPPHTLTGGWSPWMRSYPSVYNYNSHQPCTPPVYQHHPPPCHPAVAPTKKPVINIDDKVDKEED